VEPEEFRSAKDGLHPIIFMRCGPVWHRVDAKAQAALQPLAHRWVRPKGFRARGGPQSDRCRQFVSISRELMEDGARNRRSCYDLARAVREGRWPLLLTERIRHLRIGSLASWGRMVE
jgi:hypothetical protein